MRRFIIFVITLLLVIAMGVWYYLAQDFERYINNKVMPILTKYNDVISYDSLDVEKYTFSATFTNVSIKMPPSLKVDKIVLNHYPLLNITKIHSNGKSYILDTESGEELLYSIGGGTITLDQGIFNHQKPMDWSFKSEGVNTAIYDSKTNQKIIEYDGEVLNIKHNILDDGNVSLDISASNKIIYHDGYRTIIDIFLKSLKASRTGKKDLEDLAEVLKKKDFSMWSDDKLSVLLSPIDSKATVNLKYDKKLYEIIANSKSDKFVEEMAKFIKQDAQAHVSFETKDQYYKQNFKLNYVKKDLVNFDFDYQANVINDSETFKKSLIDEIYKILLTEIRKEHKTFFISETNFNTIVQPIYDIKVFGFGGKINQTAQGFHGDGTAHFRVGNLKLNLTTNIKDDGNTILSNVSFNDPKTNLFAFIDYLNLSYLQILETVDGVETEKSVNLENFKKSLIDFLSVVNINQRPEDDFQADIKLIKPNTIEINGKEAQQLLSDPRVELFVSNLFLTYEELAAPFKSTESISKEKNKASFDQRKLDLDTN